MIKRPHLSVGAISESRHITTATTPLRPPLVRGEVKKYRRIEVGKPLPQLIVGLVGKDYRLRYIIRSENCLNCDLYD